jgi:hypothetical protein
VREYEFHVRRLSLSAIRDHSAKRRADRCLLAFTARRDVFNRQTARFKEDAMGTKHLSAALVRFSFAAFVLSGLLPAASLAASRDNLIPGADIAGPAAADTGVWRTKVISVFDPVERTLVRRMYTVWDATPAVDLDFTWIPNSLRDDVEGKINGTGRLIWRLKGKPAYDRASIFAEYRGGMKDGRPSGQGSYRDAAGLSYRGEWKNGSMDGSGTLTLSGGDEYTGMMRDGKASGMGRYIDVTGEIFDGYFTDGRRDGFGTTTLPNAKSYRSRWVQGQEAEDSRLVRLAQAGGQLPQGSDNVQIGVKVDRTKARDGDLAYVTSSAGSNLMIQPDNKRLMGLWKNGDEIQLLDDEEGGSEYGVFSLSHGKLLPLTLVFEVQNRSAAPVEAVGAYLNVASSASDLQPAIQINRDIDVCSQAQFHPTFKVENFGWSAAEQATLRFSFISPNVSGGTQTSDISKSIGAVAKTTKVDLEPELRAAGVNTGTLKAKSNAGFVCTVQSPPACFDQVKRTGVFGSLASRVGLIETGFYLNAKGTLGYTWQDNTGAQQSTTSPYNVQIPLGHIKIEAECGEGGQQQVIAARPLTFKLDQTGYRLPVSFQQSIPAGHTSRFAVTVDAAKSSQHDFTVVLQMANGREIASRPINLLYYRPSWFPAAQ